MYDKVKRKHCINSIKIKVSFGKCMKMKYIIHYKIKHPMIYSKNNSCCETYTTIQTSMFKIRC